MRGGLITASYTKRVLSPRSCNLHLTYDTLTGSFEIAHAQAGAVSFYGVVVTTLLIACLISLSDA